MTQQRIAFFHHEGRLFWDSGAGEPVSHERSVFEAMARDGFAWSPTFRGQIIRALAAQDAWLAHEDAAA